MIAPILLGGMGILTAASCQAPAQALYDVSLAAEPVVIATDYSLADIATLARGTSGKAGHPPFGFYIGTFGYSIDMTHATLPGQCPERIAFHVSMSISGRRIEIGHELASRECLYSAFLAHYRKHAADDASIVEHYRKQVERRLQKLPSVLPGLAQTMTPLGRAEVVRFMAEAIEGALQGLSEDRAAAAGRVDTSAEIARLTDACADRA